MKCLTALCLIVLTVAALGACGSKHDALAPVGRQPFNLVLDYLPNADHAGIYGALAAGDFARAGIDVSVHAPSDPSAPLKLLAAGRADMAISYEPELLLARDRGLKLVSVGALVQRPLTSIIAVGKRHISQAAQLAGRTVGTAGIPYQSAELQTILSGAHSAAPAHEVNVGFDLVPAMLSGKVDATLGGFWNYEAIQLEMARQNPTVIRVDDVGVPTYDELVMVVRQDEAHLQGARIRAFLQALTRGEQAMRSDPARAADELVAANPDLDRRLQLASIQRTLPVDFPTKAAEPFGYQDPQAWDVFGTWMFEHRLLKQPPSAGLALTNEFLPGQGI